MSEKEHSIDETAEAPAPRKPWTPPEMNSLNASVAELGSTGAVDAEGHS